MSALVCSTCTATDEPGICEGIYLCAVDECSALREAEPETPCALECQAALDELRMECEEQVAPCRAACEADPPPDVEADDVETHCAFACDDMALECAAPGSDCFDTCPDPEWLTCANECGAELTDVPSTAGALAMNAFLCDPEREYCAELRDECVNE